MTYLTDVKIGQLSSFANLSIDWKQNTQSVLPKTCQIKSN